jgi:hypothetical protein
MVERRTNPDLTPEQKIIAAYCHFILGVRQSDIAVAMGGLNQGRINEACREVGAAVGITEPGYKEAKN